MDSGTDIIRYGFSSNEILEIKKFKLTRKKI